MKIHENVRSTPHQISHAAEMNKPKNAISNQFKKYDCIEYFSAFSSCVSNVICFIFHQADFSVKMYFAQRQIKFLLYIFHIESVSVFCGWLWFSCSTTGMNLLDSMPHEKRIHFNSDVRKETVWNEKKEVQFLFFLMHFLIISSWIFSFGKRKKLNNFRSCFFRHQFCFSLVFL